MNPSKYIDMSVMSNPVVADIGIFKMFSEATIIVKIVIISLVIISIFSWSIIFSKLWFFFINNKKLENFENKFHGSDNIKDFYLKTSSKSSNMFASVLNSGVKTLDSFEQKDNKKLIIREISNKMYSSAEREIRGIEKDLSVLATIASASPFVGLFGTVWGIMTSFQSIANAKNTSISIVAPGIAEALLVTAIGLVAAIPALIFYNRFSVEVNRVSGRIDCFVEDVRLKIEKNL